MSDSPRTTPFVSNTAVGMEMLGENLTIVIVGRGKGFRWRGSMGYAVRREDSVRQSTWEVTDGV